MSKRLKIVLITCLCAVLLVGILVGSLWYLGSSGDPVGVIPVSYCTAGYVNNSVQYDGMVTTKNLQSVFPSATQQVTEVFVTEGQLVRRGDKLLSYDTTLTELTLERQKIAAQQAELDLARAKEELKKINAMVPYSGPPATTVPTQPPTQAQTPVDTMPYYMGGSGTRADPYRWLWSEELVYDVSFLEQAMGEGNEVWLAFEMRENNSLKGELVDCFGIHAVRVMDELGIAQYQYSLFTPWVSEEPDVQDVPSTTTWVDTSSGYTAAEIAQMRKEKEREIRDLDVKSRIASVEYQRMVKEAENGVVYATITGTVISVKDAETAAMEGSAMMIVSGGGYYTVEVALGEYDCQQYPVGTSVNIQSWMSGEMLTGTLSEVSDLPTTGYYYGNGNPNVTFYNAVITVEAEAGIQEGEYVSVSFESMQTDDNVLYLQNMYIRTEEGRSYVYKRDENGLLKKVYVQLGACLWNTYTAVYGDLTEEDYIAFPYGKDVKEGAQTEEADMNTYYMY